MVQTLIYNEIYIYIYIITYMHAHTYIYIYMIVCLMYVYAYGFSWFGCTIDVFFPRAPRTLLVSWCAMRWRGHTERIGNEWNSHSNPVLLLNTLFYGPSHMWIHPVLNHGLVWGCWIWTGDGITKTKRIVSMVTDYYMFTIWKDNRYL